jgi:hypothetical protein
VRGARCEVRGARASRCQRQANRTACAPAYIETEPASCSAACAYSIEADAQIRLGDRPEVKEAMMIGNELRGSALAHVVLASLPRSVWPSLVWTRRTLRRWCKRLRTSSGRERVGACGSTSNAAEEKARLAAIRHTVCLHCRPPLGQDFGTRTSPATDINILMSCLAHSQRCHNS